MLRVGLTGGIGSGKTAVSDAFAELGITVIDTDIIARDVLINQPDLLTQLQQTFGDSVIATDGSLDRAALRSVAFSSTDNKARLDAIMHPAIRQTTMTAITAAAGDYCIVVVPLLIETNFAALVDRVLVVTAPHQRRLEWIAKRSGLTRPEIDAIIASQTSDEQRLQHATEHIANEGDLTDLCLKVADMHQHYLALAQSSE